MKKCCIIHSAGKIPYPQAVDWQNEIIKKMKADASAPNHLILLEHPPVFTIGRRGTENNILAGKNRLEKEGIEIHHTNRGGDITYHGPGQIVGYPIMRLQDFGKDIHRSLRAIEEVLITTLKTFGIDSGRWPKYTGVWVGDEKIAAIGIAITRWITFHGWALNVNPNLNHFGLILPCGIRDKGVTSMEKVLRKTLDAARVRKALTESFSEVFNVALQPCDDGNCLCTKSLCKNQL